MEITKFPEGRRNPEGKVVEILGHINDGTKKLLEETGISTDYLPETDKVQMQNGIEVNGKQELNQLIEDYE